MDEERFGRIEDVVLRIGLVVIVTLLAIIGCLAFYILSMTRKIELVQADQRYAQEQQSAERLENTAGEEAKANYEY